MVDKLSYNIANHNITIIGEGLNSTMSKIGGFDVFRTNATQTEWIVMFDKDIQIPNFKELNSFYCENLKCTFGKNNNTFLFTMLSHDKKVQDFCLQYEKGSNIIHATPTKNATILRFSLWFAFNLFSIPKGLMAIHSSVVVCDGKANLFLGESGTGKSTHTQLWLKNIPKTRLLNDDSPILAIENDKIITYGSPWSGKTPCYNNIGFPTNAFVRLSRGNANKIRKSGSLDAFTALQPSCPPSMNYDDFYSDKIIDFLDKIIQIVPTYRLECLPNNEAAILTYKTIY